MTLEGLHARLEPLTFDHLDALCEVGLDPELWRWTTTQIHSRDDMRAYIDAALEDRARGTALPFATIHRASGRVVGGTRFLNIDASNRRVEIGYTWIARPWQRTATNTEAKYLMLCHAFEQLNCLRVELKTDALNERSRRAIERIGGKYEGIFRRHLVCSNGRLRDTAWYSIIDPEWPEVKARLEEKLAFASESNMGSASRYER